MQIKWQRWLLLALAALFVLAANTRLCCMVEVDGERLDGLYSPLAVTAGEIAARKAAQEITTAQSPPVKCKRIYTLTLRAPQGSAQTVSDAILRASDGVAEGCGVYAGGKPLGYVPSGAIFLERLHREIYSSLLPDEYAPTEGTIMMKQGYTRQENICTYEEMAARVFGIMP